MELRDYQKRALQFLEQNDCFGLFLDMRLGKTLPVIRRAQSFAGRVLVVSDNSALLTWERQLRGEGQMFVNLQGSRQVRINMLQNLKGVKWVLLNKEAHRAIPEIARLTWDCVVLDESPFIKNPRSAVTKFYLRNFRAVPHRYILTGTPNPESDFDFVCQMLFLRGEFMGCKDFWTWRIRYCRPVVFSWELRSEHRERFANEIKTYSYSLTRKDAGVLVGKRVKRVKFCELSPTATRTYCNIETNFELEAKGKTISTVWKMVQFLWLRQLASGIVPESSTFCKHKASLCCDLLQNELSKEPVIVWFAFRRSLRVMQLMLKRHGIRCGVMHGGVVVDKRREVLKRFDEGKLNVLLIQHRIARVGVDLGRSSAAVYYDLPLSLEDFQQTRDRIVVVGKETPLLYVYLTTSGTIDEYALGVLEDKGIRSQAMFRTEVLRRVLHAKEGK
jgi:SNF2 family DNA or RNA helicase